MDNETDLGLLSVGVAVLSQALGHVLATHMPYAGDLSIFDSGHALAGYAQRVEVCRALGLIEKDIWEDLRTIGSLRNHVVHPNSDLAVKLTDPYFAERISKLNEIRTLRKFPELLEEDRPLEERGGVLYEGPRSQLRWTLTEILIKLDQVAPLPFGPAPVPNYQVGDRVRIRLTETSQVPDLGGQSEAIGEIVETPGGVVYNVLIENPPDPRYNLITYLSDEHIIERL